MGYKKDLLLRSVVRLYSIRIEVEGALELIEHGVPLDSTIMRKSLEGYQVLDERWKQMEHEQLHLRTELTKERLLRCDVFSSVCEDFC